mmetsp:Transcript_7387/g.27128  ORF Transcript_7387/g.27128 Transcript_7387/m.27128 type:complete len:226 (+) Transcript_7387:1778-2455(+)
MASANVSAIFFFFTRDPSAALSASAAFAARAAAFLAAFAAAAASCFCWMRRRFASAADIGFCKAPSSPSTLLSRPDAALADTFFGRLRFPLASSCARSSAVGSHAPSPSKAVFSFGVGSIMLRRIASSTSRSWLSALRTIALWSSSTRLRIFMTSSISTVKHRGEIGEAVPSNHQSSISSTMALLLPGSCPSDAGGAVPSSLTSSFPGFAAVWVSLVCFFSETCA